MSFVGLTYVGPVNQVLDGGQGRTNPFEPRGVTRWQCGLLPNYIRHLFVIYRCVTVSCNLSLLARLVLGTGTSVGQLTQTNDVASLLL